MKHNHVFLLHESYPADGNVIMKCGKCKKIINVQEEGRRLELEKIEKILTDRQNELFDDEYWEHSGSPAYERRKEIENLIKRLAELK